jgi:hypothetical protein
LLLLLGGWLFPLVIFGITADAAAVLDAPSQMFGLSFDVTAVCLLNLHLGYSIVVVWLSRGKRDGTIWLVVVQVLLSTLLVWVDALLGRGGRWF